MPVDLSKPHTTAKRKQARKDNDEDAFDSTHAREIELKRSRGEISCAECRRLKIRCDKSIPCKSCQRRGCAALCPNGSLATGQGTRFVLAATEHLHKRIAKMKDRIRQLEDALAILHAKGSNEPHPLLRDDLVSADAADIEDEDFIPDQPPTHSSDIIDAFGTLSVSEHGVSRFFGPTGGTEYLLSVSDTTSTSNIFLLRLPQNSDSVSSPSSPSVGGRSPDYTRDSLTPPIAGELTQFSAAFPFTPVGATADVHRMIESYLPPYARAVQLAEAYIEGAGWLFRGLTREQILDEMIPFVYKKPTRIQNPECPFHDYSGPHDLAVVFLVFAIGSLVDGNQEQQVAEGEHYHHLARAALCLQPVLEKPSMVTIQALRMLSNYVAMCGNERESSIETTWSLVTLAAQLAQSIGLHRDSARWGLAEVDVQRRRILFWDLFIGDAWQSLATGRPPSFSRDYVDCKFPGAPVSGESGKPDDTEESDIHAEFETWGCRFAMQCVSEVAQRALAAEPPSYATIMELDRKVREFPVPPEVTAIVEEINAPSGAEQDEPVLLAPSMEKFVLSHCREVVLLWIHRSFFAQAIIDCPTNPVRSNYAPSFLAAYRASVTILMTIKNQFELHPTVCSRFWLIWTYAFSAAVVFGTVVTRGPKSPLAASAIVQLDTAVELFSKAAKISRRAAKALPILTRLSEKAHATLTVTRSEASQEGVQWPIKIEDEDELEIFAGKTRLVANCALSSKQPSPIIDPRSDGCVPLELDTAPVYDTSAGPTLHPPPIIPTLPSLINNHSPPLVQSQNWMQTDSRLSSGGYSVATYPSHSQQAEFYPMAAYQHPPPSAVSYGQWSPPSPSHLIQPYSQAHPVPAQPQAQPHYSAYPPPPMAPQSYMRHHETPVSMNTLPPPSQTMYMPAAELVNLGLASRDSRLGDRWTEFMQQSGLLDDVTHH